MIIDSESTFITWLDSQLDECDNDSVVAFNINLYESPYQLELIGSYEFDPEDDDWACNEDWVPENRIIEVSNHLFGSSWEDAQNKILNFAKSYLLTGSNNVSKIKRAEAFSIGFVDGELMYIK